MAFVPVVLLTMMLMPAGVGAGEGTAMASDAPPADARAERKTDAAKEDRPVRTRAPRPLRSTKARPAPAVKPMAIQPAVLHIADNGKLAPKKIKVLNAKKIYFGKADTASKPATVKAKTVFAKIPEYQEILRRGLTKDDIEYWTLMKTASKKFRAAVKKAAGTESKDLVAEVGAIEVKGATVPDITAAVIAALGS